VLTEIVVSGGVRPTPGSSSEALTSGKDLWTVNFLRHVAEQE